MQSRERPHRRAAHGDCDAPCGRHAVVEAGEEGDALFVILDGAAVVRRDGEDVLAVGPGAYFGELALLDGEPRSATVVSHRADHRRRARRPDVPHVAAGVPRDDRAGARRARAGPPPSARRARGRDPVHQLVSSTDTRRLGPDGGTRAARRRERDVRVARRRQARAFVARPPRAREPAGRGACSCVRAKPATRCSSSRSDGCA